VQNAPRHKPDLGKSETIVSLKTAPGPKAKIRLQMKKIRQMRRKHGCNEWDAHRAVIARF